MIGNIILKRKSLSKSYITYISSINRLFSSQSLKKPWKNLTANEKMAWEQLGRNERNWASSINSISLPTWDKLDTAQKSAVTYGLGINEKEWNKILSNDVTKVSTSAVIQASESTNVKSMASKAAWTALKLVGPALSLAGRAHPALKLASMAADQVPTLVDEFADPITIPPGGIETILYLDDSGSMSGKLGLGKSALDSISSLLQGNPTRIVKFGSSKTIVSPRDNEWSVALTCLNWNGDSGSTYMWKMIEDDIIHRYKPNKTVQNNGKLRLIVITDGFDTDSPGKYHGIKGMDPMMNTLLNKGYDIEFHIIILGKHENKRNELNRYKHLTEVTGGGYIELNDSFFLSNNHPHLKDFKDNLKDSNNDSKNNASRRTKKKQNYLNDVKTGKKENFEWLKQLPP